MARSCADVKGGQALVDLTGVNPAPSDADIDAALANFGVSAPDDKTFVVTLDHPAGYFLDSPPCGAPRRSRRSGSTPRTPPRRRTTSAPGPFMMKSWTHQAEIVLVPNPNWYGQKPTLTEINYHIGGDPAQAQASFEAGELDMLAADPAGRPADQGRP